MTGVCKAARLLYPVLADTQISKPEGMEFPAFRSEEWIRETYDKMQPPAEVLKGINLSPRYMEEFETVALYQDKVQGVKETIRRSLFRQSLYKVCLPVALPVTSSYP